VITGVRARLTLGLTVVSLTAIALAVGLTLDAQFESMRGGIQEQAERTAAGLSRTTTALLLRNQVSLIRELGQEFMAEEGRNQVAPVVYLNIHDATGSPVFRSTEENADPVLEPGLEQTLNTNALRRSTMRIETILDRAARPILDVSSPCSLVGIDGHSRTYGVVRLGVSLGGLERRWRDSLIQTCLAGLLAVILSVTLGFAGSLGILKSLEGMVNRIQRIAHGDFSSRIRESRKDELGKLAQAIDQMAEDLQKRDLLKRYVSATTWDEIERKGVAEEDGGEGALHEVTVLFLDIRNYTTLSENYQSRDIVAVLNEIFTLLIDVVNEFDGIIDKFIGDALLVVFYPGPQGDDAVRAVYAGCRMQEVVREFSQRREFYGGQAISIGGGINTGTVIAGSVGSPDRKDFTVIGDPVNVAARLQERSKEGVNTRVVLSETTYDKVRTLLDVTELPGQKIRGKNEAIRAFEIVTTKDLAGILQGIEHENPRVREEAFQALQATEGPVSIPHLVEALRSPQQGTVLKAIPLLARLGGAQEDVRKLLNNLLESQTDPHVLATAVRAMGLLGGRGTDLPVETSRNDVLDRAARVTPFLHDSNARVRANAIEALDGLLGAEALDSISPLIHDSHQRVRSNAAVVLFKRGKRDVINLLIDLSRSADAGDRGSVVFTMGELFRIEACDSVATDLAIVVADLEVYDALSTALLERLDDDDEGVIKKTATALLKTRESRAALGLARLLINKKSPLSGPETMNTLLRLGVPPRVGRRIRAWRSAQESFSETRS